MYNPLDPSTVAPHSHAAPQTAAYAEWPKMIYPETSDGQPDFNAGVEVKDELAEKQQRSNWANPKNQPAHDAKAAELRVKEAREALDREQKALDEARKNEADAAAKGGGDDAVARHAATEQALQDQGKSTPVPTESNTGPNSPAVPDPVSSGTAGGNQLQQSSNTKGKDRH